MCGKSGCETVLELCEIVMTLDPGSDNFAMGKKRGGCQIRSGRGQQA